MSQEKPPEIDRWRGHKQFLNSPSASGKVVGLSRRLKGLEEEKKEKVKKGNLGGVVPQTVFGYVCRASNTVRSQSFRPTQ